MRHYRLIATPIVLLVLLGVLLWAAQWGWRSLTEPLPAPEPTPCVTQPIDVIKPKNVSVRVLNGGFTTGLAGKAAKRLETAGFKVVTAGNTEERVKNTIIRGNAENQAALELTASYFGSAEIQNDDRVDGTIDVLVGSEWGGFGEGPLKKVESDTGSLCVPPSPEPSTAPSATESASQKSSEKKEGE